MRPELQRQKRWLDELLSCLVTPQTGRMGLDVVELIMRAEEEFGIELKDEDCAFVSTCGQLCNLIEREMGIDASEKEERCASQRAFYQVRRELVSLTGKSRREITPRSLLQELIPSENRVNQWNILCANLGIYPPDLERPTFIGTSLNWLALCSILLVPVSFATGGYWFYGLGGITLWFLTFYLTRPLAVVFPAEAHTVGDIALRYAPCYAVISPTVPTRDIWPQVQKLIADQLSIPIEKVTRDAYFIRDLGAD